MADEVAFVTPGLSASVAEMANASARGTLVMKDGDALLRISQAFCGLVNSLLSSLEEFRDVELALEIKTAGRNIGKGSSELFQTSVGVEEATPEVLLVVADLLKEMVGALISDIKTNAQVMKLMPAMQKASVADHHAFFPDLMRYPKHQESCADNAVSPSRKETLVRTSSKASRMVQGGTTLRSSGKGQIIICKHSCEHHPEVDPSVLRNLPQELVELVFAKLPLPRILECSRAWYTMSKTSNFRETCSESHSNLFGLLRWNDADRAL